MSNDRFWHGVIGGAALVTCVFAILLLIASTPRERELRRQAIEHNAARYHPQTGEFEWLDGLDSPGASATIEPSHAP